MGTYELKITLTDGKEEYQKKMFLQVPAIVRNYEKIVYEEVEAKEIVEEEVYETD